MKIEIKKMKLSEIKPNPKNPRIIKDDNYKKLIKSLQEFPEMLSIREIIVDEGLIILGGNMRYKALKELGEKTALVKIISGLTEDQKKQFIVKDNLPYGEWDFELLQSDYELTDLEGWGLDTDFFPDKKAEEDNYEIPDEIKTDIVLGDLFEIGEHRLLCGDSTDKAQVERLMRGEKADMVFTDPPYGVSYSQKNIFLKSISKANSIEKDIENDSKTIPEMFELWKTIFVLSAFYCNEKSSYYICSPQGGELMMMMMQAIYQSPWQLKHTLIWNKNNHVLGRSDYNYKHEPILYGWKKKGTHIFYGKGKFTKSVWDIAKPNNSDLHPTMKPIELIENALLNSSLKNNIVIDFFLGSGSTMVAAHQLNRRCFGIEIDPQYCQVIIDRMKALDPKIKIKKVSK